MRFQQLSLIRYGKFSDRVIDFPLAPRDIHVIVGPNEAGKSTTRSALGDLLFGIPARTSMAFRHAMPELRIGAVLENGQRRLDVVRTKGNKQTLRSRANEPLPDLALQPWLGDATRELFEQMHALDHGALVRGSGAILSSSGDLGRLLFQSASGLDNLGRVLAELDKEADALWGSRKAGHRAYHQALDRFDAAAAELKAATLRPKAWMESVDAAAAANAALKALEQQRRELRLRRDLLQRVRQVHPLLLAHDAARLALTDLAAAPLLPADAAQTLQRADHDRALAEAESRRFEQARAEAQAALDALQLDDACLARADEIRALAERRVQFGAYRVDIPKRQEEVRLQLGLALEQARQLGWVAAGADDPEPGHLLDLLLGRLPPAADRAALARLAEDRAALAGAEAAACRALTQRRDALAQAEAELATLPAEAVDPALQAALDQARRLGEYASALQDAQARSEQLTRAAEHALAALGAWRRDPALLRAQAVPEPALVRQRLDLRLRDEADLENLERERADRQAELAQARRALEDLVATHQPVSQADVLAARRARDVDWQALLQGSEPWPAHAPAHERLVAQADDLADARFDRVQHEVDRQARQQRIVQLEEKSDAVAARLASHRERMATCEQEWLSLAHACQLDGLPLDLAGSWLQSRQKALESLAAAEQAAVEVEAMRAAGAAASDALTAALAAGSAGARVFGDLSADAVNGDGTSGSGRPPAATTTLATLLRSAEARVAEAARVRGQRSTLDKQMAEHRQRERDDARSADEAAQAWARWQSAWQAACRTAGLSAPADLEGSAAAVERVRAAIERMQQLEQHLAKAQAIRIDRIFRMEADLASLAAQARALAHALAPDLAGEATDEIAARLSQRLEAALAAQAETTRQRKAFDSARTGLAAAQARLDEIDARLAPLHAVAGAGPAGDARGHLSRAIAASDQRRDAERRQAEAEQGLREHGGGRDIDALRTEAAAVDIGAIAAELDQLTQDDEALLARVQQRAVEADRAQAALASHDGSARAAQAESQRQAALTDMADAALSWARTRTTALLLGAAIERHRQTRQGPMLAEASRRFADLTLGSFNRLVVDFDGDKPLLLGVRADGQRVGVEGLSEGTRDQLYLALRLAALALQAQQARPMPFIADDLFINFDDRRTVAGLRALGGLSEKVQVLFLTHHEHLLPLVQEALGEGVDVIRLDA